MDNVTLIRAVSAVLFFVLLFVLVQRRKRRMDGAAAYLAGSRGGATRVPRSRAS